MTAVLTTKAGPIVSHSADKDPIISVSGLSFGYGDRVVIDDIDFDIHEGEFVSIIGPSGCGKSTLLTMMDGMAQPDSGTILMNGRAPRPGDHERAMVFQHFALLPWRTVIGNVEFGLKYRNPQMRRSERREAAMESLRNVGLGDVVDLYPRHLSGGMQQRVGIARAFAVRPSILLMDEPFGALDAQNAEILREDLKALIARGNMTIVFVTHNLDQAIQLSDRVLLMTAGPSHLRDDMTIALPADDAPDYGRRYEEYRKHLWDHLRQEVQAVHRADVSEAS